MHNSFPLLTEQDQNTLHDALHYMKMVELQTACQRMSLPDDGKKGNLIERIMTFVQTGQITQLPKIPAQSRAKNYPTQPLAPTSLMLYGSYKNDLKTRIFLKSLIGNQFHFTAYGIDWLHERWLQGNPPTYQEFADYWVAETNRRKESPAKPKDEWRYIRFMQEMQKQEPDASKDVLMHAWKETQASKAQEAEKLLKRVGAILSKKKL